MGQLTWLRHWLVALGAVAAVLILITLGVVAGSSDWLVSFWCWLTKDESGSTTIRNLGLFFGALVALALTVRRIKVADRQAATAQKGLLHDRYQKGAEMLGGRLPAVRLGGIYALQQLATEHPEPFLPLVVRQYCAFVRHPLESDHGETGGRTPAPAGEPGSLREDVRAAMETIVALSCDPKTRKKLVGISLDLSGANLSGVDLSGVDLSDSNLSNANLFLGSLSDADLSDANLFSADLSRVILSQANLARALLVGANLSRSNLSGSNLSGAHMSGVDLSGAELCGAILSSANLSGANLSGANLSGADLSGADDPGASFRPADRGPVRGLTQEQLDRACADPGDPPNLRDALSPDGSPLVWRGSRCGGSDA